ncbi:unnamed protein product [Dovyalis caffra]|uniref:Uncharacterized protein n=1 Tax=Dovyalis caffra TaxID=77055 RepID=A0AAV1RUV2_9ROSI|nr:unnamed protein product [Dovyalis caffra]
MAHASSTSFLRFAENRILKARKTCRWLKFLVRPFFQHYKDEGHSAETPLSLTGDVQVVSTLNCLTADKAPGINTLGLAHIGQRKRKNATSVLDEFAPADTT